MRNPLGGRKAKPTALRVLQGNPGKRKLNDKEPQPVKENPYMPEHLDEEAQGEWERVTPILDKIGVLTEIDGTMLAGYCQLYSNWCAIQAEKKAPEFRLLMLKHTVDGAGNEHVEAKQNPLLVMERLTLAMIRAFCAEFGMTPSSRARLQVPGKEEASPWEEL